MITQHFAFYGRVSTEDMQDPTSSKRWQLSRATSLIEPHGGHVVEEFFDIGQSRSLPWRRRPESARLLDAFRDPGRGFDAVVIGEPARAFYGAQFQNTFPLFTHFQVQLWVPDVGGYVDPESDGPEMMMAIYGTMSAQERRRMKIRVRTAMATQAKTEGRFLGGRPPYGYGLADAGPHPNASKAAMGARLHRLEVDPAAAPIVGRIFAEYLSGRGLYVIAEGLTRDGIPSPAAHDPARNRHRHGRAWSKSAVRAILCNPRYTGRGVWNRQRRDEVLLDIEDVAAGHQSKMRWNDPSDWVWSAEQTHEALVSSEDFAAVAVHLSAGSYRTRPDRKSRAKRHTYVLSGLVRCGVGKCGHRMGGHWIHNTAYYRCKVGTEYAAANDLEHPKTVYVRESAIVPKLDEWLGGLFLDTETAVQTLLMANSADDDGAGARREAATRKLADCDQRLARYRSTLDAGADPTVVAAWIAQVQSERLDAERELRGSETSVTLTKAEARRMVVELRDLVTALGDADPQIKAQLYAELGVSITFDPGQRKVIATAQPYGVGRVGEGT